MTYRSIKDRLGGHTFCVLHCLKCSRELYIATDLAATTLMQRKPMRCPCGGHIKELEELADDLRSDNSGSGAGRRISDDEED